jgi:chloramphenicol O-acetyltransferase
VCPSDSRWLHFPTFSLRLKNSATSRNPAFASGNFVFGITVESMPHSFVHGELNVDTAFLHLLMESDTVTQQIRREIPFESMWPGSPSEYLRKQR